jgi:hypothetical protein
MLKWRRSNLRIQAYDRRLAAVHEAGHFVVASHYGLRPSRVWIGPSPGNLISEKTWIGQTCFDHWEQLYMLRPKHRAMIGIAGAIAENAWLSRRNPDAGRMPEDLLGSSDSMSPTDWSFAGCEPGSATIRLERYAYELEDLLRGRLWDKLCSVARQLIVVGEIKT